MSSSIITTTALARKPSLTLDAMLADLHQSAYRSEYQFTFTSPYPPSHSATGTIATDMSRCTRHIDDPLTESGMNPDIALYADPLAPYTDPLYLYADHSTTDVLSELSTRSGLPLPRCESRDPAHLEVFHPHLISSTVEDTHPSDAGQNNAGAMNTETTGQEGDSSLFDSGAGLLPPAWTGASVQYRRLEGRRAGRLWGWEDDSAQFTSPRIEWNADGEAIFDGRFEHTRVYTVDKAAFEGMVCKAGAKDSAIYLAPLPELDEDVEDIGRKGMPLRSSPRKRARALPTSASASASSSSHSSAVPDSPPAKKVRFTAEASEGVKRRGRPSKFAHQAAARSASPVKGATTKTSASTKNAPAATNSSTVATKSTGQSVAVPHRTTRSLRMAEQRVFSPPGRSSSEEDAHPVA